MLMVIEDEFMVDFEVWFCLWMLIGEVFIIFKRKWDNYIYVVMLLFDLCDVFVDLNYLNIIVFKENIGFNIEIIVEFIMIGILESVRWSD